MYESGPSQDELDMLGFALEDIADMSDTEIWPENWMPFQIFKRLGTQWVVGPGGPVGLNYSSILIVFDIFGVVKKKEKEDVFDALRVLESEALRQMNNRD
jgi:hypothetical protein